ncbi:hypothetical protein BJ944DRAFT_233301 [Cunninghamella echinulata]|nr:hypothetical protein BJ944DRAFT_233301 [Cunninghamella echinulata]
MEIPIDVFYPKKKTPKSIILNLNFVLICNVVIYVHFYSGKRIYITAINDSGKYDYDINNKELHIVWRSIMGIGKINFMSIKKNKTPQWVTIEKKKEKRAICLLYLEFT